MHIDVLWVIKQVMDDDTVKATKYIIWGLLVTCGRVRNISGVRQAL